MTYDFRIIWFLLFLPEYDIAFLLVLEFIELVKVVNVFGFSWLFNLNC